MGLAAEQKRRYTIQEYLEQETRAEERHEFRDGEIIAMPGGTYSHSVIIMNFGAALTNRLQGKPCRALDSNMRIRITGRPIYVYPDISILCGPPQFDADDSRKTTLLNPTAVIEVLSESTQAYDTDKKFEFYRHIPTLKEYVLVNQDQPSVQTYFRRDDGSWLFYPSSGLTAVATLHSVKIDVPLADIYSGIDFESPDSAKQG